MAVRRPKLGPHQDEPAVVDLGRIIVTIDDLNALLRLLMEHGEPDDEIVVEFDGGSFDKGEDLRSLSDAEIDSLIVVAPSVRILLDSGEATATGERELCNSIYGLWARSRRTTLKPRLKQRRFTPSSLNVVILVFSLLGLLLGADLTNRYYQGTLLRIFEYDSFNLTLLLIAGCLLVVLQAFLRRAPLSYAVILPITLDEFRKDRPICNRYRVTTAVSITAILTSAITAIVVKVFIK